MPEDWKNMLEFADALIRHAEQHRSRDEGGQENYVSERISIVHFDHALELVMKAYLMHKGYLVYEIDTEKIKKGVEKSACINKIIKKDKTLGFADILEIFSKILGPTAGDKKHISGFHKLRNEIQHRALNIPVNKEEKLEAFKPVFRSVYLKAFPERQYPAD